MGGHLCHTTNDSDQPLLYLAWPQKGMPRQVGTGYYRVPIPTPTLHHQMHLTRYVVAPFVSCVLCPVSCVQYGGVDVRSLGR
jgi:hypothetical protein